jgi:hypothetical protein
MIGLYDVAWFVNLLIEIRAIENPRIHDSIQIHANHNPSEPT